VMTLLLVGHAEGGRVRAGEVARRLSISAASATALVDRLVEAGMLVRSRGDDRRVVWISVSASGQALLDRLRAGAITRISAVLARADPDARDAVVASLRRVATFALEITDQDPAP
jgi:DNA-binding MarR family transcriptional regulator